MTISKTNRVSIKKWGFLAKISLVAWTVAICVFGRAGMAKVKEHFRAQAGYETVDVPKSALVKSDLTSLGSPKASFTIVSFNDYQCPYCKEANLAINLMLKAYPNDLRVIYHQYPLETIHEDAWREAVAAVVAAQAGKFSKMHARLVVSTNTQKMVEDNLSEVLNQKSPVSSSQVESAAKLVLSDIALGRSIQVQVTPTLFLIDKDDVVRQFDSAEKMRDYLSANVKGAGQGNCADGCGKVASN